MEDRETPRMRKYGESETTRIMMATVPHVTSGLGLRKFQADGFLFDRVYMFVRRVTKETVVAMAAYHSYRLLVTYLLRAAESFLRN